MAIKRFLSGKYLPLLAYAYLCIPVLLFLLFWVRPILSVPLSLAVVYGFFQTLRNAHPLQIDLKSQQKKLAVIFILLLLWVISSGIGGLVWQNRWDHMYRNALFHDLVRYDWPVVNFEGATPRSLCYYIGFWLPSALFGKLFGFQAGYLFQLIWAFAGVALAFLLLSESVKKVSFRVLFLFVFFSGLDLLPYLFYVLRSTPLAGVWAELSQGAHLELSLSQFNSSSNTTLLYWLYNQTIPFWVGFLLLLRETASRTRLFTYMLLVLFAPFPSLALAPLLVYLFARDLVAAHHESPSALRGVLYNTFSIENITGVVASLVIALYFMGNASAGKIGLLPLDMNTILHFVLFLITEFLVFLPFVFGAAKKDAIFWILFGTMLAFSFVKMGESFDFAWRTCIPAAAYIMLLLMRQTLSTQKNPAWKRVLFFTVILIGTVTPAMEMLRTAQMTYACYTGKANESLVSFSKESVFDLEADRYYGNFIGRNDSFFAEYLQRGQPK